MAKQLFSNNATARTAALLANGSELITLAAGKGALFSSPAAGEFEMVTLSDSTNVEIVKMTSRSGDVLTVVRGQEGTAAREWPTSTLIEARVTAGTARNTAQNTSDLSGSIALSTQNCQAAAAGNFAVSVGKDSSCTSGYSVTVGNAAISGLPPRWSAGETIGLGTIRRTATNIVFKVVVADSGTITTGATEPTWPANTGDTVTDPDAVTPANTVTWMNVGGGTDGGFDMASVGARSNTIGSYSVAFGALSNSGDSYGTAAGYASVASWGGAAVGAQAAAVNSESVAIGLQSSCAISNAWAGIAVGSNAKSLGASSSNVIGDYIDNRIDESIVLAGLSLVRKDSGETAGTEVHNYAASQVVLFSKVINLKTLADNAVAIPVNTGATFYPDEIGIVITQASGVTGNPSISFGVTGDTVSLLASTAITAVAAKNRSLYTPLSRHGVNSLTASVKTAASGTTLQGRFYWKGVLVED